MTAVDKILPHIYIRPTRSDNFILIEESGGKKIFRGTEKFLSESHIALMGFGVKIVSNGDKIQEDGHIRRDTCGYEVLRSRRKHLRSLN